MSVNKTTLIGFLGGEPVPHTYPDGTTTARVSLATTDKWKDKATQEPKEKTEWHTIVFYGKLAEIACEYLSKGSQVYVEGKLRTRKWSDKQGITRTTTEIVVNDLEMLGKKPAGEVPSQEPEPIPPAEEPEIPQ